MIHWTYRLLQATVKAMDAVQSIVQAENGISIKEFMLAGPSKVNMSKFINVRENNYEVNIVIVILTGYENTQLKHA